MTRFLKTRGIASNFGVNRSKFGVSLVGLVGFGGRRHLNVEAGVLRDREFRALPRTRTGLARIGEFKEGAVDNIASCTAVYSCVQSCPIVCTVGATLRCAQLSTAPSLFFNLSHIARLGPRIFTEYA